MKGEHPPSDVANHGRTRTAAPRLFYVAMSLLMLAIVTYGFSQTVGDALIHTQRPHRIVALLSFHGVVFYAWMVLFVAQSALVRWRNLRVHRLLVFTATAMLTNAAFARFPGTYLPGHFFYLGTDLLIVIGIAYDIWTEGRVHIVYRYAMPLFLAAEIGVMIPAWRFLG